MTPQNILCEVCGVSSASFTTRRSFKKHLEVHEGPHNCPLCGQIFSTKRAAYQHKLDVHKEKLKSDCCYKTFSKLSNMKRHLQGEERKISQASTENEERQNLICIGKDIR